MKFVKILYIWEHDVSLGDTLTNFYSHLSLLKDKYKHSIVYAIIHPRTYNTNVSDILLKKGIVDYVYPLNISQIHNQVYFPYKNLLDNIDIDIILHNQHTSYETCELVKKWKPDCKFIQTQESNFGYESLFDHCNTDYSTFLRKLKESYHTNYIEKFVNDIISNSKKLAIFFGSTRKLANISNIGVKKIINVANRLNYQPYLVGTTLFNVYDSTGVDWKSIYSEKYDGAINLIGNNWNKTLEFINTCDVVISGPTGAAMLSPLVNKNQILILGGDSPIMEGCISGYTDVKYTRLLPCKCENYPCDPHLDKKNLIKYTTCFETGNPVCLNEELNYEDLLDVLRNI